MGNKREERDPRGLVREMTRLVLAAAVGVVALLSGMPGAGAQLPPVDEATDPIEETVEEVGDTAGQAVEDTVDTVEQTTDAVSGTTQDASEAGGDALQGGDSATGQAGSVTGSISQTAGAAGTTTSGTSGGAGQDPQGSSSGSADRPQGRGDAGSRLHRAPNSASQRGVSSPRIARIVADTGQEAFSGALAYVPLVVRLTNDADGDGSYSDVEASALPRGDVPFQVRLENVGPNELAIVTIRDASPTPIDPDDSAVCGDLAGIRLAPGEARACRFTVKGFAPPEGERAVTVFEVDVADTSDPSTVGTVSDTTVIRTGDGSVLGLFVRRGLDALASTGARIVLLVAGAIGLAAAGVWFIVLGNRRRAQAARGSLRFAARDDSSPDSQLREPNEATSRRDDPSDRPSRTLTGAASSSSRR
jgi:hypothetical protein